MRNLKRVLSLTLASVMLLGMMVIGTSAASDYSDVDYSADNVEAIEVLNAIGVMNGDLDSNGNLAGTFRPGDEVKRSEMARIMAALMDLDYDYYIGANPFTDMVGHWAEGYAAACYANGIIAGRTNTTYDPDATVTAVEAAAMLMRALGYFQNRDVDYADGFEISTIKQAGKINLFDKVDAKTNEPMTRNDVAQLILNTLQSGMVEPDSSSKIDVTVGDAQVSIGSTNYVYVVARDPAVGTAINDTRAEIGNSSTGLEGDILDLGEKLYNGDLKLKDTIDVFGRPSRQWEYDGTEIGTYAKDEQLAYAFVGDVTGKDLYDLLGSSVVSGSNAYDVYCYIDGLWTDSDEAEGILGAPSQQNANLNFNVLDMNKNNKAKVGGTGVGTITEVYVDHNKKEARVAVINTYLAIADSDYDTTRETVTITAYGMDRAAVSGGAYEYFKKGGFGSGENKWSFKPTVDEFPSIVDIVEKDPLLVTVAEGEIQTMQPANVLAGVTISSFKKTDSVVSDGTTYKYTTTANYKFDDDINTSYTTTGITNLKDRTYNIYLDNFDNLIGIEEVEAKNNYVFLTGIDLNGSNRLNQTADASAIFLDGTMATIKVNVGKSTWATSVGSRFDTTSTPNTTNALLNTWCTYTVSGDVYTVTEVKDVGLTSADIPGPVPDPIPPAPPVSDPSQTPNNTGEKLAQFNQRSVTSNITIDDKHYRMYGGGKSGEAYYSVYADDDTVFLTVKLGELSTGGATNYGIIKDVVSVSTGIEDTDLTAWTDTGVLSHVADSTGSLGTVIGGEVASGVYGLYNKDGLIVAAVVVGEDAGSAKDFVYVNSGSLKSETYNGDSTTRAAGDGLWTWVREVIRDGEKVDLVQVGDKYDDTVSIATMDQYKWYQVSTNSEGNVVNVTAASELDEYTTKGQFVDSTSLYVRDYKRINDAIENSTVKTVVYEGFDDDGQTGKLEVRGNNTLAFEGDNGSGFWFTSDVRVVLVYYDRNKSDTQIVETGKGPSDLKWMVDIVNDRENDRDKPYYVSALIVDGKTTDIVIYDSFNDYTRPSSGSTIGAVMDDDSSVADVMASLKKNKTVTIDGTWIPSDGGRDTVLTIGSGETLIIKGSFNATDRVQIKGTGTLIVDKAFTAYSTSFVGEEITISINAGSITLELDKALTIGSGSTVKTNGTSTVGEKDITTSGSGNLYLQGSTGRKLTVNGTVTINGNLVNEDSERLLDVNGSMTVNDVSTDTNTTLTIGVYRTHSLHVNGTLRRNVKVIVGMTGTAGYAYVGTVENGATVEVVEIDAGNTALENNGVPHVGTVKAGGTVKVKDKGKADVDKTESGAIIDAEDATSGGIDVDYIAPGTEIKGVDNVTEDGRDISGDVDEDTGLYEGETTPVTSVTIDQDDMQIIVGESTTLTATVTLADGTTSTEDVTWESSDTTVATIDENGELTAVAKGTTTITATSTYNESKYDTIEVEVITADEAIPVETITLSETTLELEKAGSETLTITAVGPEGAAYKSSDVTWSSNAENIATVSNGTVTATTTAGTATITVTITNADSTTATAECEVTVLPSSDADLEALTYTLQDEGTDGDAVNVSDEFDKDTLTYTVDLNAGDVGKTVYLTGTKSDNTASISGTTSDNAITLIVGNNTASLTVTPESGAADAKTYTVTFFVPKMSIELSADDLNDGELPLTLSLDDEDGTELTATVTGGDETTEVVWTITKVDGLFASVVKFVVDGDELETTTTTTTTTTGTDDKHEVTLKALSTGTATVTATIYDEDDTIIDVESCTVTVTSDEVVPVNEDYDAYVRQKSDPKALDELLSQVGVEISVDDAVIAKYKEMTYEGDGAHETALTSRMENVKGVIKVTGNVTPIMDEVLSAEYKAEWKAKGDSGYEKANSDANDTIATKFWFNFTYWGTSAAYEEIEALYHFEATDEQEADIADGKVHCVAVTNLGFFVVQDKNGNSYMTLLVQDTNGSGWKSLIRNPKADVDGSSTTDITAQGHRGDYLVTVQSLVKDGTDYWIIDTSEL